MTIPQFEPLPPNTLLNRIINKVLAPLFYLVFTIVTSIVVVPIYTIIENFKKGRNSKGGQRFASNEDPSKPRKPSQAKDFLASYSSSYVGPDGDAKEKSGHHHHHQHRTPAEKHDKGL